MKNDLFKYIGSNILIKAFVFLSQILVAFFITAEELGEVKTTLGYVEVLSLLACLGMNASLLSIAPKIDSYENRYLLYNKTLTFVIAVSLIIVLLVDSTIFIINDNISSVHLLLVPLVVLNSVTTILITIIQSERNFNQLAKGQAIAKLMSLPLVILFTYIVGIYGYLSALYLSSIITIIFLLKAINFKVKLKVRNFDTKIILNQWEIAKGALLSNVLGTLGFYVGLFITNTFINEKNDIGNYAFALILLSGFEVVSRSTQQYFIPHFSKEFNTKEFIKLENKFLLISSIIAIPVFLFSFVISMSYESFKYYDSIIPFNILLISWVLSSKYTLKSGCFIACGKTIRNFKASVINVTMTTLLSLMFGFYYGIVGIALARLITVLLLIIVYKKLYEIE